VWGNEGMDETSKRDERAYAAQCRADEKPLTMRGLKAAIRKELVATIGPLPKRARRTPEQVEEASWHSTRALKRQAYAARCGHFPSAR